MAEAPAEAPAAEAAEVTVAAEPAAPQKSVNEKLHDLPIMHADGCCFKFLDLEWLFTGQLLGCAGEHKEEEKVGILYYKLVDKGCGSFETSHHALVSWLTLTVWVQIGVSIFWFLIGLISGAYADVTISCKTDGGDPCSSPGYFDENGELSTPGSAMWSIVGPFFWVIWTVCWAYTGYWSFNTGNKLWMILFNVQMVAYSLICLLIFLGMLGDADAVSAFDLQAAALGSGQSGWTLDVSVCCGGLMTLLAILGFLPLTVFAIHTTVFGFISMLKAEAAPGHLAANFRAADGEAKPVEPTAPVDPQPAP